MKVKEFVQLLTEEDMEKELTLYNVDEGDRLSILPRHIDFDVEGLVEINFND